MTTTIKEIEDKLKELEMSAENEHGVDACKSAISWLFRVLPTEWTDAEIDPSRNAEAMKLLGGSDTHGGAPVPHPSATATVRTQEEQEVVEHYKKLHDREVIQAAARGMKSWAEALTKRLKEVNNLRREDADRRESNYYETNINNVLTNMMVGGTREQDEPEDKNKKQDMLSQPQAEFRKALTYFNKFRKAHDLTRDVQYAANMWDFGALLVIFFVVETIVNGFFYAAVTDGLVEGWGVAGVVSAIVLAIGGRAGWAASHLRGLTKRGEEWEKHGLLHIVWWSVWTLIFFGAGFYVIMFAYLYRDTAALLLSSDALDNVDSISGLIIAETNGRLIGVDWALQSGISAGALIGINVAGFFLAFWKFHWDRDDCIPGYKNCAVKLKEKREYYIEEIQKLEEDSGLKEGREYEFEKELKEATPTKSHIREMQSVIKQIMDQSQEMQELAYSKAEGYTEKCKIILQTYREANREARPKNDKNGPAYFDKYPKFDPGSITDFLEDDEKQGMLVEDIDALEVDRVLATHRNKAVEIVKEVLIGGRREHVDQHKSESRKQWQDELTKKQKDKKKEEAQEETRKKQRVHARRQRRLVEVKRSQ